MMEMYPEDRFREEDLPPYEETTETSQAKYEAQKKYCNENNLPFFAFEKCHNCRRDYLKAIDMKKAQSELITGCTLCGNSFCD